MKAAAPLKPLSVQDSRNLAGIVHRAVKMDSAGLAWLANGARLWHEFRAERFSCGAQECSQRTKARLAMNVTAYGSTFLIQSEADLFRLLFAIWILQALARSKAA